MNVPLIIQELIFDSYEKLCAMVISKGWSTVFFLLDIGLFQGYVLSTILFDCVFQLLLDFLRPMKKLGYIFKEVPEITMSTKAYADDLTLVSRNAEYNQAMCNQTNVWLKWTCTMKAKPSKCISLGFKMFFKHIKSEKYTPVHETIFSPFDPCLTIDNQPMKFLLNFNEPDTFKAEHFKFLGRWIHYRLSEAKIKTRIWHSILEDFTCVDSSPINGFMKLWIYQFFLLARLSWPFLIYDFDRTFAIDLQKEVNKTLKKWAGVSKSADNGLLFRSKENFGLGLTSIIDCFERMQLIKCLLLQNAIEPSVQFIYKNREVKNAALMRTWRATKLLQVANAEVDLNLKFPGQNNRQGIGSGNFNPNPKAEERRKMLTAKAFSFAEQKRVLHSASLKRQGIWLKWSENTIPFDFSWKNLIWSSNSQIIKFVLSSSINWVKNPRSSATVGH